MLVFVRFIFEYFEPHAAYPADKPKTHENLLEYHNQTINFKY